jgi:hypothetical protein
MPPAANSGSKRSEREKTSSVKVQAHQRAKTLFILTHRIRLRIIFKGGVRVWRAPQPD